jgi:hypothetical protein
MLSKSVRSCWRERGRRIGQRLNAYSQALAQSAEMADRVNRLFLRTLRAFRDLYRYAPTVTIQNLGGQVNVAAQQVVANS